jgi:hypothetical protein
MACSGTGRHCVDMTWPAALSWWIRSSPTSALAAGAAAKLARASTGTAARAAKRILVMTTAPICPHLIPDLRGLVNVDKPPETPALQATAHRPHPAGVTAGGRYPHGGQYRARARRGPAHRCGRRSGRFLAARHDSRPAGRRAACLPGVGSWPKRLRRIQEPLPPPIPAAVR